MNLIVPMAGNGFRFFDEGYLEPKPLLKLFGKPFFYWAVNSVLLKTGISQLVFVVLKAHVDEFGIDECIRGYYPEAEIVVLKEVLSGPSLSVLAGLELIRNDEPVLINDCDHAFGCRSFFMEAGQDGMLLPPGYGGAIVTFASELPQYSYAMLDNFGEVTGTIEKQVVSNRAICGAYLFSNASLFKSLLNSYSKNCKYDELFISGLFNEMINNGLLVREYRVDHHVSFGTPEEFKEVLKKYSSEDFIRLYERVL